MNHRRLGIQVAGLRLAALGAAGIFLVQACSLGDGQTPGCDPAAAPGTEASCQTLHPCDPGDGGIAAGNEPCCLRRASYELARCGEIEEPDDFRPLCVDVPTDLDCSPPKGERDPRCCCGTAQALFDECMTRGLTTSASTATGGGMGGSGGALGGGGPGGSPGVGGAGGG